MATDTANLLEWLLDLLKDDSARADFLKDPDKYLDDHGYGNVSSGDIYDSLCLIHDNDYKGHRDNDNDHDGKDHHPAPHHNHHGEDGGHYLKEYITNNYTYVDDRDNNIDNSLHQHIDTDGGDFDQTVDNDTVIASGDGSSAIGGDNNGNVSSAGHDSTTAFGDGDANNTNLSHADFGSGSAVAVGDSSASGHAEDNDSLTAVHGGDGTNVTTASDDSSAGQDVDQHASNEASFTHTDDHSDTNTHTDVASHNPVDVHDVGVDVL